MVRDAVQHSRAPERMALADAFDAATRGAHWAAFADRAGLIAAGWQADLAIWDVDPEQLDAASGLPRAGHRCAAARMRGHGRGWTDHSSIRAIRRLRVGRLGPCLSDCRPGRGLLVQVLVVLAAGVALGLSWQPYGFWPLLLVGIPALTLTVRGLAAAAVLRARATCSDWPCSRSASAGCTSSGSGWRPC